MKIDSNIAALYQPGIFQSGVLPPQADARPQQEAPRRQGINAEAVREPGQTTSALNAGEYERVRSRVEREQDGRVVPQGLSRVAQTAVSAYDSIASAEERNYNSRVLGIDTYA
jgi:hypothetical protein